MGGHSKHEYTSAAAYRQIFSFFDAHLKLHNADGSAEQATEDTNTENTDVKGSEEKEEKVQEQKKDDVDEKSTDTEATKEISKDATENVTTDKESVEKQVESEVKDKDADVE